MPFKIAASASSALFWMSFFFFNDTATTEIYTLSLHDALPIRARLPPRHHRFEPAGRERHGRAPRSEEHTSELQSLAYLVCRLLLETKNTPHSTPSAPSEIMPFLACRLLSHRP